ncbi:transcriptional regulator with XRE-family HTH domain [Actinoalloteichus hoggarensis]|uniref:Anaerobic benzoate catabolism transcriptional regulator n=1 Tax=Actinoalloteichus hoggarensis TaxID=1470176 RepID=A0A221W6G3_9PSEU|nr:helix-turn-helix transcriptional regulator [Actinoalloteichus hoggarensis]ASO20997.1 anaerobic benzoate catabolism transcriptional regulator [Actinoalloteichus hoggarensis]MBB5920928.1 transcriptional regulator with XRE-family HTH domain [Actinoalloteichus hoggarensis]
MSAESHIGARIRGLRGRVLTQRELADAAGVSVDLIRKLEQGARQRASIGSLHAIARALDVDVADLLGGRGGPLASEPQASLIAVRHALTTIDDLLDDEATPEEAPSAEQAGRTVGYGWAAYWRGRYTRLLGLLPSMIAELRATAAASTRPEPHELLSRCLWLAGCTLVHLGQPDPAWLAIRQAISAADRGGDDLLAAVLRGSAAWQLLVQGRQVEAQRLAAHAAASIQPGPDASPDRLAAYGSLITTGATAAARAGGAAEARHLLAQAADVAAHTGDRVDYETYFGPSQVAMQTVDVAVVTEDYAGALTAAARMPPNSTLPLASRARHLTDQAFAAARLGRREQAVQALLVAERMAPDWMEYQTLPRRVVSELLGAERSTPLRALAHRLGVSD